MLYECRAVIFSSYLLYVTLSVPVPVPVSLSFLYFANYNSSDF